MWFIALNIWESYVKLLLNVQDNKEALNVARKFVKACAQAWSLSTLRQRLVLRLGYNISKHFAQAQARK